jgi:hydrogenase maturation protease
MQKPSAFRIAIVGMGNTIRSDDGLGCYICAALEKLVLPNVVIMTVQQLDPEIVEDLLPFDKIVIVDASLTGDAVAFSELDEKMATAVASSHHMNAAMVHALARRIYGKELSLFLCAVKGENFEMGDHLSATAQKNAGEAIKILTGWIQSCSV